MSAINRIFFWAGLVVATILLILLSMLDLSTSEYVFASRLSIAGLVISFCLMLIPLRGMFSKKWNFVIEAIVLSLVVICLLNLAISTLYSETQVKIYILSNIYLVFTFPLSILLFFLKGKSSKNSLQKR